MLALAAASAAGFAQQDTVALHELVVTGTRQAASIRHLPMTVSVVGRDALTAGHQTSVLPTVMQQVPGLMVTSRSVMGYGVSTGAAGGINLRGISGGAGQLLVLIDGHPQYNGVYGHPISDSYQTLMAERVEVVRGPASVLYGSNAMGGVVNIVTRQMKEDGVKTHASVGAGSYGTLQTEASNQVRSGKFSSTVAAQYSRTDNHRPRMGFEQYGGYMKAGYEVAANWKASVDADITHFNASYPGQSNRPLYDADQWITRGMVSAAVENHYDRTSGALSVYTNFGRHKIDDGTDDPTKPTQRLFRSKDALTGLSLFQSTRLFEGNRLTAGFDLQHIYGNAYYTSKQTGSVIDTPNKQSGRSHRNEVAGYADFRQDVAEWLTIDAGIRLDHHSVTGSELIPQAGIVVRPLATGEVKAMASKGFRNPTMREMYLYPPSNEELRPERIWSYELSWHHRMGTLSYGANIYYIKGDNMIQTVNRKNVNTGEIENCGAEIEADCRIDSHWSLTTNHSFLDMKERQMAAAPKYKGFVGCTFRQGKWHLMAGLQYLSGMGLDDNNDGLADLTAKDVCLVNATANYALNGGTTLWLRGENLLARKYEVNYGYPMPRATFMGGIDISF